jgi:ammonium transporter, Amt family
VGWFGCNAGSNPEANGVTALAFVSTMVATAAAALSWLLMVVEGKPSLRWGICSGAVAVVAVTPASGFAGPIDALVLGLVVSPVCILGLHGEERVRL